MAQISFDPSKVVITKLKLDNDRKALLERKKVRRRHGAAPWRGPHACRAQARRRASPCDGRGLHARIERRGLFTRPGRRRAGASPCARCSSSPPAPPPPRRHCRVAAQTRASSRPRRLPPCRTSTEPRALEPGELVPAPRARRAAGVVGWKGAGAAGALHAGPGARWLPQNSRCKFLRCPVGRSQAWAGLGVGVVLGSPGEAQAPPHPSNQNQTPTFCGPRPKQSLALPGCHSPTAAYRSGSRRLFALHERTRLSRGSVRRCSARRRGCNVTLAGETGFRMALSRG